MQTGTTAAVPAFGKDVAKLPSDGTEGSLLCGRLNNTRKRVNVENCDILYNCNTETCNLQPTMIFPWDCLTYAGTPCHASGPVPFPLFEAAVNTFPTFVEDFKLHKTDFDDINDL